MMYDVVIIGAGPAGISAGIYAASRGKKVLITEKNTVGGLIGKVSTVTHYAGIMTEETGSSFAKRLKIQTHCQLFRFAREPLLPWPVSLSSDIFHREA